ncbi:guanine nucleotide-binding protein G(q) subunit alpha-like [Convolutriloba macropyga]|uniref:guanine nucleotide-binding protein G(q) subunit alpha-like n=1 Tax=Convolutriloba macropyga TaxID=536237 RepID=UPI003F51B49A
MGCQTSTERQATKILIEDGVGSKVDQSNDLVDEEEDVGGIPDSPNASSRELTFLLLGTSQSGKTTLFKMLRSVFSAESGPPTVSEKQMVLQDIKKYVFKNVLFVIKSMKSHDISFEREYNRQTAMRMVQLHPEYFENALPALSKRIVTLWDDKGVQKTYRLLEEKRPIWNLDYFVQKFPEMTGMVTPREENKDKDQDYVFVPNEQDLSRIQQTTITINTEKVTVRNTYSCRVIDMGGLRRERSSKWCQCFRYTTAVMYMVDCSTFDVPLQEDSTKNRLVEALECFELLVSNRFLQGVSFICFLNKQDVLLEKICERKKRIYHKSVGFVGYSKFEMDDEDGKDIEKVVKRFDYPERDIIEFFKTRAFIKHMFQTIFEFITVSAQKLDVPIIAHLWNHKGENKQNLQNKEDQKA